MIFYTNVQAETIRDVENIFVDGTFNIVASDDEQLQLFIISTDKCNIHLPLCYGLFSGKQTETYAQFFYLLQQKKLLAAVKNAFVDFETAIHNALSTYVQNVKICGDVFHFKKAVGDNLSKRSKSPEYPKFRSWIDQQVDKLLSSRSPSGFEGEFQKFTADLRDHWPEFANYFENQWGFNGRNTPVQWAPAYRAPCDPSGQNSLERFNRTVKDHVLSNGQPARLDLMVDRLFGLTEKVWKSISDPVSFRNKLLDSASRRTSTANAIPSRDQVNLSQGTNDNQVTLLAPPVAPQTPSPVINSISGSPPSQIVQRPEQIFHEQSPLWSNDSMENSQELFLPYFETPTRKRKRSQSTAQEHTKQFCLNKNCPEVGNAACKYKICQKCCGSLMAACAVSSHKAAKKENENKFGTIISTLQQAIATHATVSFTYGGSMSILFN